MKNAEEDFSGDRSQAGSNYDTYCCSNLPDHQTTCLIHAHARARTRGGVREGIELPQQSKSHPFAVPERVWISF